MADETSSLASSVVMRAVDAKTFTEMESFVKDLESRPVERLLRDLPQLAELPGTKVSLVSYVLSAKYRGADAAEKVAMRESVAATVESMPEGETRTRVMQMLGRMR